MRETRPWPLEERGSSGNQGESPPQPPPAAWIATDIGRCVPPSSRLEAIHFRPREGPALLSETLFASPLPGYPNPGKRPPGVGESDIVLGLEELGAHPSKQGGREGSPCTSGRETYAYGRVGEPRWDSHEGLGVRLNVLAVHTTVGVRPGLGRRSPLPRGSRALDGGELVHAARARLRGPLPARWVFVES